MKDSFHVSSHNEFSFQALLDYLEKSPEQNLFRVIGDTIYRPVRLSGERFVMCLKGSKNGIQVFSSVKVGPDVQSELSAYLDQWLDHNIELDPFYDLLSASHPHRYLLKVKGFRSVYIPNLFEAFAWSIIGQQINVSFAQKVKDSLVTSYGRSISFGQEEFYLFPEPSDFAKISIQELKEMKFSARKAEYVHGVAREFMDGNISRSELDKLSTSEFTEKVCQYKGIGVWTSNYVAMRSLKKPDCIPIGDTGIQEAIRRLTGLGRKPTSEETIEFYSGFDGWESYLTFYLWRSLPLLRQDFR